MAPYLSYHIRRIISALAALSMPRQSRAALRSSKKSLAQRSFPLTVFTKCITSAMIRCVQIWPVFPFNLWSLGGFGSYRTWGGPFPAKGKTNKSSKKHFLHNLPKHGQGMTQHSLSLSMLDRLRCKKAKDILRLTYWVSSQNTYQLAFYSHFTNEEIKD